MTDRLEVIIRNIKTCIILLTTDISKALWLLMVRKQDAYIVGVNEAVKEFTGKITAVVHRLDDVEEKWVVAPENLSFSEKEIMEQIKFQEQYFKSEIRM